MIIHPMFELSIVNCQLSIVSPAGLSDFDPNLSTWNSSIGSNLGTNVLAAYFVPISGFFPFSMSLGFIAQFGLVFVKED